MALKGQAQLRTSLEAVPWKAPQANRVVLVPLHLQAAVQALQAAAATAQLLREAVEEEGGSVLHRLRCEC